MAAPGMGEADLFAREIEGCSGSGFDAISVFLGSLFGVGLRGKRFTVQLEGGFEYFVQGGLVLFHGHKVIDFALLDELPSRWDFVALFFDGLGSE
jgi:hypothetical protein